VYWCVAKILQVETKSRQRKYKESCHMVDLTNSISQLMLEISPIWIHFVNEKVSNPSAISIGSGWLPTLSYCMSLVVPLMMMLAVGN
jgi:hypothetical protein